MTSVIPALFVVACLGACGSSPTASFYTLHPDASLAPITQTGRARPVYIVVSPVTIPDLVDRPQIVTRGAGNNQVVLDEFARWAEPLKSDMARAIAGNLSTLLAPERVSIFSTGLDAAQTWRVRIDIMRFEATRGEAVTIEAQWTVAPPGKTVPFAGQALVRQPIDGQSYDALVSASDQALGVVSRQIAAAIQAGAPQ